MPYHSLAELPEAVREHVPKHGQEIYKESFNSALDQYGEEERAHKVAWAAVKQKYDKDENGNWHAK